MTKKLSLAPFAHLLGMARAEDKDEKEKGRRAEEEDDKKKGRKAEEEDKDEHDAEEREEEERAEEEEEEEEEEDGKKGKKAKKAKRAEEDGEEDPEAEDDDEDEEMRGNSAAARARRRERARCKAIFATAAAGTRPDVAASLAFDTNMTRKQAIKVLNTTAAGSQQRRGRLDERMNSVRVAQAGADAGDAVTSNLSPAAAAIIAAGEKARGK